ncbi:MAG: response regulator transcription factor [Treponema sp.]|jgi:DNA-binding NarL/FixJ family response regulator|nr:response regulator transcription factor [Treponema sp.]
MPESGKVKTLIVDDHPLFSRGLSSLINSTPGFIVAGEAINHGEALIIAQKHRPNLAIIDINLGNESGIDLIPKLKAFDPDIVILILSMYDERYYSERVLKLGAHGYIMKNEAAEKIQEVLNLVMSGKTYISGDERERIIGAATSDKGPDTGDRVISLHKLSDRELQVFSLFGKGFGTIEIASRLGISTKTIDTHKEHIKSKLRCNTSQELRQFAIEWISQAGPY